MLDLTLAVIGKDMDSFKQFWLDRPHENCDLNLVPNTENRSSAEIGNWFLENAKTTVVGVVHADTLFEDGALSDFTQTALEGKVCGIVGRDPGKGNRWCHNFQEIPGLVRSLLPGKVSTLDSNSVFLRKDLNLRFDEKTFDNFHCYVEDLCLQAQHQGIEVVVPVANAYHTGVSTLDPAWQKQYGKYRALLGEKWKGTKFETT